MLEDYKWKCRCCGNDYTGLPLAAGFENPDLWNGLSPVDRKRSFIESEICVTRYRVRPRGTETNRFVRAVLALPIRETGASFHFIVWGSVSAPTLSAFIEASTGGERHQEPYFSYLSNELPEFAGSIYLPCELYLQEAGQRPQLRVHSSAEHPLYAAQRDGVGIDLVERIASGFGHGE